MKRLTTPTIRDGASNLERLLNQIPQGRAIAISYARQISIEDLRFKPLVRDIDANKRADLGELCDAHAIGHAEFLALVIKEAFPLIDEAMKLSHMISTGVVAARLPKVVERGMIEGAKRDGVADRHFILQKEGFHVAPKGMNINLNQINASAAGLPSFEDETRVLSDILAVDGAVIDDVQLTEGETEYADEFVEEDEKELQPV